MDIVQEMEVPLSTHLTYCWLLLTQAHDEDAVSLPDAALGPRCECAVCLIQHNPVDVLLLAQPTGEPVLMDAARHRAAPHLLKIIFKFYFMPMGCLLGCMFALHLLHAEPEAALELELQTVVSCCEFWKQSLGPLGERQVPLTTEPSLQPSELLFKT